MTNPNLTPILTQVSHHLHLQLQPSSSPPVTKPLVVMTCGIAGSGKSTLAHSILADFPNRFTRLSIDEHIYRHHGRYRIDYPISKQEQYQAEAAVSIHEQLPQLLRVRKNVVLDLSLWSRAARDEYKRIIEANGGEWMLVYFKAESREVLWERIQARRQKGINADSMFDITEEIFEGYVRGFQAPCGEGEVVVSVSS